MSIFSSAEIEITAKDRTAKGIQTANRRLDGLRNSINRYALAIGASAAAVYGAIRAVSSLVDAYSKQEQAEAKLNAAIVATGNQAVINQNNLKKYASELQRVTTFGDEATISAMGMVQQLANLNEKGLKKITPLIQDFSAAMGVDLQTAANLVGKTLGSSTNALSRYGIEIDASADKSTKLAQLTEAMTEKFGGMARALGETATGKITRLHNALGDIKEIAGKTIIEGIEPLINAVLDFVSNSENINTVKKIFAVTGAVIVTVGRIIGAILKTIVNNVKITIDVFKTFGKIIAIVFNPKNWFKGKIKEELSRFRNDVSTAIQDSADNWADVFTKTRKQFVDIFDPKEPERKLKIVHNNFKTTAGKIADEAKETAIIISDMVRAYKSPEYVSASDLARGRPTGTMTVNPAATGTTNFGVMAGHGMAAAPIMHGGSGGASTATMFQKIMQGINPLLGIISGIAGKFIGLITSISSVQAILDPITTILQSAMKVLTPIINEILQPLQGALIVFGELLGHILAPILKALSPAITWLAEGFVKLYNKVLVPVGNGILWVADKLIKGLDALTRPFRYVADLLTWVGKVVLTFGKNVVTAIWNVTHPFRQRGYTSGPGAFSSTAFTSPLHGLNYQKLNTIDMAALTTAGAEAQGTATAGGGANYTAGRAVTMNVTINTDVIAGDGGFRQLALMIRQELQSAEALGV